MSDRDKSDSENNHQSYYLFSSINDPTTIPPRIAIFSSPTLWDYNRVVDLGCLLPWLYLLFMVAMSGASLLEQVIVPIIVAAVFVWVLFNVLRNWHRSRRLKLNGQICFGEFIRRSGNAPVCIHYQFISPKTGNLIQGKVFRSSGNWRSKVFCNGIWKNTQRPPQGGDLVWVVYFDDTLHSLL
jgi:hypothetical protein